MFSKVFGYKNTHKLLRIIIISDPIDQFKQVGVRDQNDRNETNNCGGTSRLAMHLRCHLIITSCRAAL